MRSDRREDQPAGVRPAAVAGTFYPADPADLAQAVAECLEVEVVATARLRGVIAPHAGYVYSGGTAGHAYATVAAAGRRWERVVVAGPSHFVAVRSVALPSVGAFRTPLGDVPVDRAAVAALGGLEGTVVDDRAHGREHSLEVQLPFLQRVCPATPVVPLAIGPVAADVVATVLQAIWTPDTLLVLSTDLSHYLPLEQAQRRDDATCRHIVARDAGALGPDDACGFFALRGLLEVAAHEGLAIRELDRSTSADATSDATSVVGYAAFRVDGWSWSTPGGRRRAGTRSALPCRSRTRVHRSPGCCSRRG